jgi:hypothetical protein
MFKIVSKVENKFKHFLVKQCFEGTKLSRKMGRNVFIADVCNYLVTSKSDGSDLNIFVLLLVFQQRSRIEEFWRNVGLTSKDVETRLA